MLYTDDFYWQICTMLRESYDGQIGTIIEFYIYNAAALADLSGWLQVLAYASRCQS